MRSRIVAVFAGALLVAGLIAGPVTTPRADAQAEPVPAGSVQVFLENSHSPTNQNIAGGDWPEGEWVRVRVLHGGTDEVFSGEAQVVADSYGGYAQFGFDIPEATHELDGDDIVEVVVLDPATGDPGEPSTWAPYPEEDYALLTYDVVTLSIDSIDAGSGLVSGTVDVGYQPIQVTATSPPPGEGQLEQWDNEPIDGQWSVNFATDINGRSVEATAHGGASPGSLTYVGVFVGEPPPPPPQPPSLLVFPGNQVLGSGDWPDGETVTLTILREGSPVHNASTQVQADAPPYGFDFGFQVLGMLQVGDTVTVSVDGSDPLISASHVVQFLAITSVDVASATVSGIAAPDAPVSVSVDGQGQGGNADSNGDWEVNFPPGSITEQSSINAFAAQGEGQTWAGWFSQPSPPSLQVILPSALFAPGGWPDGDTVEVTITDDQGVEVFTGTSTVVGQPCPPGPCGPGGWALSTAPYEIQAGDHVEATAVQNPSYSVSGDVQILSVTDVDYENNLVTGTAAIGSSPTVTIGPFNWTLNPTADTPTGDPEIGSWTADFTGIHDLTQYDTIVVIAGSPSPSPLSTIVLISGTPPPTRSVSGTILDEYGDPLPNTYAVLCLGTGPVQLGCPGFALTGANFPPGSFSFPSLASGNTYTLRGVQFNGPPSPDPANVLQQTPDVTFELPADQDVFCDLRLRSDGPDTATCAPVVPGTVTGTVTGPHGPVESGTVYDQPWQPPGQPVGTITDGQYTTVPLAPGDHYLRFEGLAGSGLVLASGNNRGDPNPDYPGPVTVEAGEETTFDVTLERHTSIWGTIVDENGDPLAGHVGYCATEGAPPDPAGCNGVFLGTDQVGADGVFQFTYLLPAYYQLWAGYSYPPGGGYSGDGVLLDLSPGSIVRCDFVVGDTPGTGSATCDDGDGVDESGLPPGYDGNGDEIPDVEQANVATFPNAIDQQYVTIATPTGTLANVAALDPATLATPPPEGANLPFGAFTFEVHGLTDGASADVDLHLPATPTVDAYFKVHDDTWTQFNGASFAAGQTVTLTLTDGGAGDADGTENGVVVDPGAPADVFDFAGFYSPVNNPPVRNAVQAGRAIPVKFSLGGDQGLDIFAEGYPKSHKIDCDTEDPIDEIESTVTAGSSTLTYDASSGRYHYVWKTDKAWDGCRQLVLKLTDGTTHKANFDFK